MPLHPPSKTPAPTPPSFAGCQRLLNQWRLGASIVFFAMAGAQAQGLPPEVDAALARAKIPREAMAVLLVDAQGQAAPRVSHRANWAMNPASVMKLVTTYAALDLLGPSYTWATPIFVDGPVRDGTPAVLR